MSFGVRTIVTSGRGVRVSADGRPDWKAGGITIDWSTVTPVNADTTLPDGTVVKNGDSYLRYGTVMCLITASGLYGPYDSTAMDGRETLTRGKCYILDENIILSQEHSGQVSAIEGGLVYLVRITGVADNPAEADILTAFPNLRVVRD